MTGLGGLLGSKIGIYTNEFENPDSPECTISYHVSKISLVIHSCRVVILLLRDMSKPSEISDFSGPQNE